MCHLPEVVTECAVYFLKNSQAGFSVFDLKESIAGQIVKIFGAKRFIKYKLFQK
jgi:hypothetical protein